MARKPKRSRGGRREGDGDTERNVGGKEGRTETNGELTEESYSSRVECPFSWFLSSSLSGEAEAESSTAFKPVLVGREAREASLGDTFQANSGSRLLAAATELANVERTPRKNSWKLVELEANGRRRKGDNGAGTP